MVDYNKRLAEVDVLLNYLSEADYEKIPKEIINAIKDNKDKNHIWEYDESKELKDQKLSRDTIALLSYINMEYLLNKEQKEYMEKIHEINEQERLKKEYSNQSQYDYNDLFKNNKKDEEIENVKITEYSLVEYKEQGIFSKLFKKIRNFFKKK